MLRFFRRLINSRAGLIVTFVALGIIALAFAGGDVSGLRTNGMASIFGGGGGNDAAKVGDASIPVAELKTRVRSELEGASQQQPGLDMAQFIAGGGLEGTLERLVNSLALERFGAREGIAVSKRAIDGEIASIPGLQGPTGQFDPQIFRQALAQRRVTEVQVRDDLARDRMSQQLTLPITLPRDGSIQVAEGVATPYTALLLEKRQGQIAFVPSAAMGTIAAPNEGDLQLFYRRNLARYTVPERRAARYAVVSPAEVKAQAAPSDAEIAHAYAADHSHYAASETRDVSQVVVADQAGAAALAAKVKGGTAIADAARAAGLEPSTFKAVQKPGYAAQSSPAVADAVFAAAKGAVVGPVKGALGWTVARVDTVTAVPGRTLAQARGEIAATLTKQKTTAAMGSIHDAIDDALGENRTFDEVIADRKLAGAVTPPLTASGINPDAPDKRPAPVFAPIVSAIFQAEEGDPPQMVPLGPDGSFALVALGRVVPAAPRPFAQARAAVARDLAVDRARAAARKVAGQILQRVNGGTALAAAVGGAGVKLPAVRPIGAARADLTQQQGRVGPELVLLFSMAQGTAKLLEAPGQAGWFIIHLDQIVRGDPAGNAGVVAATRTDIGRMVGREYAEQFVRAVRADVGATTNKAAVARVKADLLGGGDAGAQ